MSELIIFDGDGTLWDSYDAYLNATIKLVGKRGKEITQKDITGEMMAKGIAFTLNSFLSEEKDMDENKILELREEMSESVIEDFKKKDYDILCDGIEEIMHIIKQNKKQSAIVSNSHPKIVESILENTDLKNFDFDWIIPRLNEGKGQRIMNVINEAKVAPDETLMIDDSLAGIKYAEDIGCYVALVLHDAAWFHKTPNLPPLGEILKSGKVVLVNSLKSKGLEALICCQK